ncbi:MAG: hypothetical protein GY820_18535 [Gammaproteobacteria bacterium]|nr:hypothetical protein [Gammaproteobacteria bacterium]
MKDGPCGLAEFPKLQEALDGAFQLKVYDANRGLSLIYEGPKCQSQIYVLLADGHAYYVTSIWGLMKSTYWCGQCEKGVFYYFYYFLLFIYR